MYGFPNDGEPLVEVTLTCATPGCENATIPIVMITLKGAGAICGVCNQPILHFIQHDLPQEG